MTARVYRSSDASAPVLADSNGSLVALLKACLVNGYGAKAAAGWTNPYNNGANVAVFRSGTGSNQRYLRVDDAYATNAYSMRNARIRGYEAMTAHSTGTGLFPTSAQHANGLICNTRTNGYGAFNDWILVATEKVFHLLINTGDTDPPNSYMSALSFGDFLSYKSGDTFNTFITARTDDNGIPYYGAELSNTVSSFGSSYSYMARRHTGTGSSQRISFMSNPAANVSTYMGGGSLTYPHGPDSGLVMHPLLITNPNAPEYIAGVVPGMWDICHDKPAGHRDTWTGLTGTDLAGKSFEAFSSSSSGQIAVETSNTW